LDRGANPKHAILFAKDVPPSKVVKILDRYLMLYIRTADKLTRTARWLENFEGGIEVTFITHLRPHLANITSQRLKGIILNDDLGICADLEREMEAVVGTYACEWTAVVNDPEKQKMFRQFINTVSSYKLINRSALLTTNEGRDDTTN
jgi:nitrite reductase (NAD(P)H)